MPDALQKLAKPGIGPFNVPDQEDHLNDDQNDQDHWGNIVSRFIDQIKQQEKRKCKQQQS